MPQIVLHIGAFKSGTSFIQHTLSENREALAARGILLPVADNGSAFRLFIDFWTSLTAGAPVDMHPPVEQVHQWDGSHVLISGERMSLLGDDGVSKIVDWFAARPAGGASRSTGPATTTTNPASCPPATPQAPEEALDTACGLYLGDPTAWITPPKN